MCFWHQIEIIAYFRSAVTHFTALYGRKLLEILIDFIALASAYRHQGRYTSTQRLLTLAGWINCILSFIWLYCSKGFRSLYGRFWKRIRSSRTATCVFFPGIWDISACWCCPIWLTLALIVRRKPRKDLAVVFNSTSSHGRLRSIIICAHYCICSSRWLALNPLMQISSRLLHLYTWVICLVRFDGPQRRYASSLQDVLWLPLQANGSSLLLPTPICWTYRAVLYWGESQVSRTRFQQFWILVLYWNRRIMLFLCSEIFRWLLWSRTDASTSCGSMFSYIDVVDLMLLYVFRSGHVLVLLLINLSSRWWYTCIR